MTHTASAIHFVKNKTRDVDVLSKLGDFCLNEFGDGGVLIFRELLFVESFVRLEVRAFGFGYVFETDSLRFAFCYVRRYVCRQCLKVFRARDEIRFAIDLDQNARFAFVANERGNQALLG